MAEIRDVSIPGPAGSLRARYYRPDRLISPAPLIVYFHGGGFVVGDLDTHDAEVCTIAASVPALALSIDYRLAPENPFPAGLDDCESATRWAIEHAEELGGHPSQVVVAGDSAGGNLAAAVALRLAHQGGSDLAAQLLIYPNTSASGEFPSIGENGQGYWLTRDQLRWFAHQYAASPPPGLEWWRSPLVAPQALLRQLPPAIICTAQYDPLRDEGNAYARRLAEAGVLAWHKEYPGLIHDFFGLAPLVPAARAALLEVCTALSASLAPHTATSVGV
jgi:acetyl esterase